MTDLLADEDDGFVENSERAPKYMGYNRELASSYGEYDELPTYLKLMRLPEFLDYLKPGEVFLGADVLFDVEGFDRSDLFMSIYVRTAHDYKDYFPLIRLGLDGPVIDAIIDDRISKGDSPYRISKDRSKPKGTMYSKGAFRSLMAFLERELPQRGFKGIFLEQVHNEILQSVALRYGFERLTKPTNICFIKHFKA
jgi:hypothetical protein